MATLAEDAVGLYGACQDDWELGRLVDVIGGELTGQLVIEIGSDQGGTLWLWRRLGADVIAVTLHTRMDGSFRPHGALVVCGDSASAEIQRQVAELAGPRRVAMVFVDGGHDYETASSDIYWALRLAPRGYVVVHDVNRRIGHPEIETFAAWLEYADDRPHMTIARRGEGSPGVGIIFPREY
jgi:cephalosporin hydroxylase